MADEPCPACGGTGITEHEEHTVEIDEDGHEVSVVRRWSGPCSMCHGSGTS